MTEKRASSEIAQSRERQLLEQLIYPIAAELESAVDDSISLAQQHRDFMEILGRHIVQVERDTRERCAQIAEHFLDELTAEEFPPHGLHKASMRWDSGHSEQFVKWVVERIRGKE